jgi:hypothetical protein
VRNTWKHLELDAKFHRIIMRASGDRRLADFVDTLRDLQMMSGRLDRREDTDPRRHLRRPSADFRPGRRPRPSGAATTRGDHTALTSRLLIAQKTGEVEPAEKFESAWIDLLHIPRRPRRPTPAVAGDLVISLPG